MHQSQELKSPVRVGASPAFLIFKHLLDRLAAIVILVPIGAIFLVILAWLVRRDSPGPALFRQTRAGRNGRPFTMYKFRTMRTEVDPYGDSPQSGEDPRITKLGRWLREKSFDELPQLINVLRGEMSLIGPRPLYVQQIGEWNDRQKGRLLVKPGLTGLAQINGRGELTIEEKLEWDVRYVESIGLLTDISIFWRTIRNVRSSEGIYEKRYSAGRERRSKEM